MKDRLYKILLAITLVEGILALAWFLDTPSMDRTARFLGYSPSRLALAAVLLVAILVLAWLTIKSFVDRTWLAAWSSRLEGLLVQDHRWASLAIAGTFAAAGLIALLWLGQQPRFYDYAWYSQALHQDVALYEKLLAVYRRSLPILMWITLVLTQATGALFFLFAPYLREPEVKTTLPRRVLVIGSIYLASIHWIILALKLPVFTSIPGWYWIYIGKGIKPGLILFPLLVLLLVGAALWVMKNPSRTLRNALTLVALGYVMQTGFGFIEGEGFESIRLKWTSSYHSTYAAYTSSEELDPLETIRNYEARFGDKMFPRTKPPGVMLTYITLQKLADWVAPRPSAEGRFLTLSAFIAYGFPLLATATTLAIFAFLKPMVKENEGWLPSFFFFAMPNVLLLPLFLDQAFYPLLFMLGVILIHQVVAKGGMAWGALAGALLYMAIFITFSMLPLMALLVVWVVLDYLARREGRDLAAPVKTLLSAGVSFLAALLLFQALLNYNAFDRYQRSMQVNVRFDFYERVGLPLPEASEEGVPPLSLAQRLGAARLNVLEFAAAVGFPVFLLAISRSIRTGINLVKKRAANIDVALGALLVTFLAQVLFGPTLGEVTRLWLYWTPIVAIFAGLEISALFNERVRNRAIALYLVLQSITVLTTFQFQDFVL